MIVEVVFIHHRKHEGDTSIGEFGKYIKMRVERNEIENRKIVEKNQ